MSLPAPLDAGPLVVLDTEGATSSGAPHLLELAAVLLVEGEVEDTFEALCLPPVPIDPETSRHHGITDEGLGDARQTGEVLAAFFAWIGDAPLCAHDARADAATLSFACARAGLAPPPNPLLDTLPLARAAFPDAPDHRLDTLAAHLGLEADGLHRALPDAALLAEVLRRAVAELSREEPLSAARLWKLCGLARPIELPDRPNRRPSQLRRLERARDEERTVVLAYGTGEERPARVEVLPRLLYRRHKKGYLEAEELASGTLKTYRLDRVQRVEA